MLAPKPFQLKAPFEPTGDQPAAIEQIVGALNKGTQHTVLKGVTGSGKTFTMANVIQQVQRPTLVLAHNKTLAAQLFAEFREFFPENAVQYFVSYYDYYQPEAYVPSSDTFIEKESTINQEIEKFRHASTHALLTRRDTIIIASVSCIYGLGSPDVYRQANLTFRVGEVLSRKHLMLRLAEMQYERNDVEIRRGRYQVQGEQLTVFPAYDDFLIRITQFGDTVERIELLHPVTFDRVEDTADFELYPAKHYLVQETQREDVLQEMEQDLEQEVAAFEQQGKLLEAQRLKQRTRFDIEMIRETGTVSGIENYSRYFDRRPPGTAPGVLLDYFPKDFLLIVDESHITIPQIGGMYAGDRARKETLVQYGFRLRGAMDNRPLTFPEFEERVGQRLYVSATPGAYESHHALLKVEQVIRPTGIVDPQIEVRPTAGQITNLLTEIEARVAKQQRVLVTTLTKRMAEDLNLYFLEHGVKVQYLHSDVETLERTKILQDLRRGTYDVIVGINLLREGLDLPEVSLVAILDADKEGFLRSATSLIQTIGRAARHPEGVVIMYADRQTSAMQQAIEETNRRRSIQEEYNTQHGIVPQVMVKAIATQLPTDQEQELAGGRQDFTRMKPTQRRAYLEELREKMRQAALHLNFEQAAELRDEIARLQNA